VAIYVFFVLFDEQESYNGTQVSFLLDGHADGSFRYGSRGIRPWASTPLYYNRSIYARENLPDASHTLVISAVAVPGVFETVMWFDYAVYTYATAK
jgi:hypothetical protein